MSRFLVVTWDGAGNLVPTLGLARRLSARGHEVRVLGHRSIQARCGSDGWRFSSYTHAPERDSAAPAAPDEVSAVARDVWFNEALAGDVRNELAREDADALIVDCMLFGALSVGQAMGIPTVSLFHAAFALFRGGPLFDMLSHSLPALNGLRRRMGCGEVPGLSAVHDACALSIVATPREFEPPLAAPPNVRFVGPILDGPPLMRDRSAPVDAGAEPRVLVSFSTSDQRQQPVLSRVLSAIDSLPPLTAVVTTGPAIAPATVTGGERVRVVQFVPHEQLLPRTSLVITHAGLGTVMSALSFGVPMVCIPLGRDQFFNAGRVAALGAGRVVDATADARTIAHAVTATLQDPAARRAARQMASAIAAYPAHGDPVREVEQVALTREHLVN